MVGRNKEQEQEVIQWIEEVLGEKLPNQSYEDVLKDGVVLCNLINKIAPGSVKKIQSKGTNFQLMENIQRFQAAIKKYGVPEEEIFQTADLFERRNIPQVTLCIYSLGRIIIFVTDSQRGVRMGASNIPKFKRMIASHNDDALTVQIKTQKHSEYTGPRLGPKMAEENKREFTEAQLRAHEGELNLQMGYNKGATQSGQGSFGNTRHM